jgi:hypothetical protein
LLFFSTCSPDVSKLDKMAFDFPLFSKLSIQAYLPV